MVEDFAGNAYANPDNFAEPSFPEEIPAPASDPDAGALLVVRYSSDWAEVLSAAVDQLLQFSTWKGDDASKLLAVERANNLKSLLRKGVLELFDIIIDEDGKLKLTFDGEITGDGVDLDDLGGALDRWVDETGDVMTGRLTLNPTDDSTDLELQQGGIWVGRVEASDNIVSYLTSEGVALASQVSAGTKQVLRSNRMDIETPVGSARPSQGSLRFGSDQAEPVIALQQNNSNNDYLTMFDDLGVLRAAAALAGHWHGAGVIGFDHSSTDEWRQQFKLSGLWADNTDATRKGGLSLSVDNHVGSEEIIRVDTPEPSNPANQLHFFSGPGFRPSLYEYTNTDDAVNALLFVLEQYGLIESWSQSGSPIGSQPAVSADACNAAWFIAQQMADQFSEIFDAVPAASDWVDFIDIINDWFTPLAGSEGWISLVQFILDVVEFSPNIVSDLNDLGEFVDDMIEANFDWIALKDDVANYSWDSHTKDLVNNALDIYDRHPDVMQEIIMLGSQIPSVNCQSFTLPCENKKYDFRWSGMQGCELETGQNVFAVGIQGLSGGNYEMVVNMYFDQCVIETITVRGLWGGGSQRLQIVYQESDGMGGWTTLHSVIVVGSPFGVAHDVVTTDWAQYGAADRIRVRMEPTGQSADFDDYISTVDIELE